MREDSRERFAEIRIKDIDKITCSFKWLKKFENFKKDNVVLDIGCGLGYNTLGICKAGLKGIGGDIRYDLIEKAHESSNTEKPRPIFLVCNGEILPFKDNIFDIVMHISTLEHIKHWEDCVKEAHRVLKKGGLFYFGTTNKLSPRQAEINNFPFYSWLPQRIKDMILPWIIKNRPDMINYSDAPAINWFTFGGLKKHLAHIGFTSFETVDLVSYDYLSPRNRKLYPVLYAFKKFTLLRFIMHFFMQGLVLYSIKN